MKNLKDLFRIIELTRSQPQYGYALAGIAKDKLSNLAEHHYLVTFIAWQLAMSLEKAGAKIDVRTILEYSLVHDLGELFGGDIAMPYGRRNPKAKRLAKAFEAANIAYLARFFGDQSGRYKKLAAETILDPKSDEAIIAKIADYIEVTHYKLYVNVFSKFDVDLVLPRFQKMIKKIKDPIAKRELTVFITDWGKSFPGRSLPDILYS